MENYFLANGSGDKLYATMVFLNQHWNAATAENRAKYLSELSTFEQKHAHLLVDKSGYDVMSDTDKKLYHANLEAIKKKIEKKKTQLFKRYILKK